MKYFKNNYWYLFAYLLLGACANVVSPSGGPKDVTPPKVIKATPAANSKNFKGKTIKLNFDEFVQVNDVASQVVTSPFMNEIPDLKVKGKSIVVSFKDTLKPNTTYSISFGKAIADVNEKNVLKDYRYVFSTGDVIDSLILKGTVKDAFTLATASDILVMLYDKYDDSIPYKKTPIYISKTDESGAFYFSSLKEGRYKLFALKDANGNFLFDPPGEKIAFIDTLVTPEPLDTAKKDSLKKNTLYNLSLFEENPEKQKLLKASAVRNGKLLFVFRKPVENLSITPLTKDVPAQWYIEETSVTKDTIALWLKNPDMDSLELKITDNNVILDTAKIALIKKGKSQSKRKEESKSTSLKLSVFDNGKFDFYRLFNIESYVPLSEYNFNKIVLKENKDTVKAAFSFTDSIKKKILMNYKWKEETQYALFIPPGTFKDMFGNKNDTVKIKFRTTALKDYGNIKLALKSKELQCSLVVQLVNTNDDVIQKVYSSSNDIVKFAYITPGSYKIKVICDANKNKKWDTGNYLKKIQPEKVFYYPTAVNIKANWDVDLDWTIAK